MISSKNLLLGKQPLMQKLNLKGNKKNKLKHKKQDMLHKEDLIEVPTEVMLKKRKNLKL